MKVAKMVIYLASVKVDNLVSLTVDLKEMKTVEVRVELLEKWMDARKESSMEMM